MERCLENKLTGFACGLGVGFRKREDLGTTLSVSLRMVVAINETRMRPWILSHEFTFVQGKCEEPLSYLHEDVNCAGGSTGLELTVWL